MKRKKHAGRLICAVLLAACVFWLCSVLFCEVQTQLHGDTFSQLGETVFENEMRAYSQPTRCKILRLSRDSAQVYYYTPWVGGVVVNYARTDDTWQFTSEGAVWSASGSADDIIWPYIR